MKIRYVNLLLKPESKYNAYGRWALGVGRWALETFYYEMDTKLYKQKEPLLRGSFC